MYIYKDIDLSATAVPPVCAGSLSASFHTKNTRRYFNDYTSFGKTKTCAFGASFGVITRPRRKNMI